MAPFEIYTREFVRTTAPRVTVTNLGRIAINQSATKLLRRKQEGFAFLLWDKTTNTVGVQPVAKEDQRTYPLRAYGPKGRSGTGFSAVTFFNHINYDWSKTRSFDVEWRSGENMLTFTIPQEYLKGRSVPVEPRRFPRSKTEG
jgi:hypothetical protein